MLMQITLKSGAQIELEVEALEIERDQLGSGDLIDIFWKTPKQSSKRLRYIRVDEIAAIVEVKMAIPGPGPIPSVKELQAAVKEAQRND